MNEQWISDCDGNLIGWIYQDCGRNDLWCFGPSSHGLADVIYALGWPSVVSALEAFQLKLAPNGSKS